MAVNPAFLPKITTDSALSGDIELKAFVPDPSTKYEQYLCHMCPVQALKIYLAQMREVRVQNRALFVHFDPDKAAHPISKATLGCWLSMAIHDAYVVFGKVEIIRTNPHSVRGVAMTRAKFARVPPEEICLAATWETPCTFARHYRLDLAAKKTTRGRPQ